MGAQNGKETESEEQDSEDMEGNLRIDHFQYVKIQLGSRA